MNLNFIIYFLFLLFFAFFDIFNKNRLPIKLIFTYFLTSFLLSEFTFRTFLLLFFNLAVYFLFKGPIAKKSLLKRADILFFLFSYMYLPPFFIFISFLFGIILAYIYYKVKNERILPFFKFLLISSFIVFLLFYF